MPEKLNIRDHKHRLLAAKYELRRKLYLQYLLKSSFARVRNRCISTGRPRSIVEFFRISPIVVAAGPQARVVGPLPSAPDQKKRSNGLRSEMLT
ncbi:unnamed protein product [Spirodela intermedia]|uniref:Small ribosomal subunit protein uS14m n=1 Tax=Spirodela intermedia TaxID=51605 RepID=A0A7I8JGZ9_SPIIN|nr:unnamed protein product [Spirodela intermedia]CAA6669420.1 unnamed protein product [Spirodela intermedia]